MGAYEEFVKTNERAQKLIETHKELNPRGKPKVEHADILRAAVVLCVAAMDAYLHDLVVEKIARFVRAKKGTNLPGGLVTMIKENVSHDRLVGILFEKRPLAHIATVVRKATADRTYQEPAKIEGVLKILGVQDLWFQVGRELGITKEKAKVFIQSYVTRRHEIVHRGDLGAAKKTKGKLRKISRPYAEKCVRDVSKFVEAINTKKMIDDLLKTSCQSRPLGRRRRASRARRATYQPCTCGARGVP